MTQSQLAEKFGLSTGYMSMLLSGDRRISWPTAKRVAGCFDGLEPATLMDATPAQLKTLFGLDDASKT
jgi:transcriptional regulator with XRE-family HTH domain